MRSGPGSRRSANADALFTSPDPKLHANKQVAHHIQKDLLEAGHWAEADKWLTDATSNAASGLKGAAKPGAHASFAYGKPLTRRNATAERTQRGRRWEGMQAALNVSPRPT